MSITGRTLCGVLAIVAGCGGASGPGDDGGGGPSTGSLAITTTSSGNTLDPDGYDISLDGGPASSVVINGVLMFDSLAPGSHAVALSDLATNCTVTGAGTRTVTIVAGQRTDLSFSVTCTRVIRNQIVFQQGPGPAFGIALMNIDGSGLIPLLNDGFQNEGPVVSPDGTMIAFTSTKTGTTGLYVMTAEGKNIRQLAPALLGAADPDWSPDGQRIVFLASRQDSVGINPEIAIINADGTGFAYLTSNFEYDGAPSWSPGGTRIVFVSHEGADGLYTMNPDGSDRQPVPNSTSTDQTPAWSPDGTRVAFTSTRDSGWEIYTMQLDGGDLRRLTTNAGTVSDLGPRWSPNGLRIAFASDRGGASAVYTMDAATGASVAGPYGGTGREPMWAP